MYTFFFFFGHTVCGILVLQPRIRPSPPTMEAWSLNHWTAREVQANTSILAHSRFAVNACWVEYIAYLSLIILKINLKKLVYFDHDDANMLPVALLSLSG